MLGWAAGPPSISRGLGSVGHSRKLPEGRNQVCLSVLWSMHVARDMKDNKYLLNKFMLSFKNIFCFPGTAFTLEE